MHTSLLSTFIALAALSLVQAAPAPLTTQAKRDPSRRDYSDAAPPRSTPLYIPPPPAEILPIDQIQAIIGAATGFDQNSPLAQALGDIVDTLEADLHKLLPFEKRALCGGVFGKCPTTTTTTTTKATITTTSLKSSPTPTCLNCTNTEKQINSLFSLGGQGTTVKLCAGATITTTNPVIFTAPYQTLTTNGSPTGSTRATLVGTGVNQTNIITGNCLNCDGLTLSFVQLNGNRPALGFVDGSVNGNALIEMGGTSKGHTIDNVHAYETRGWSCAHAIEGNNNSCTGMTITNSQFGPCGQAPSAGQPQQKRDGAVVPPGQWADGISLACASSKVSGNVITDATDGGIVIFGSPKSTIQNNTIIASTRQLMGGINAVDAGAFNGDYTGTVVTKNTITSDGAMIKIGLALGTLTWGSYDNPSFRTFGGSFTSNTLTSGTTGYFGFGVSAAGVNGTTVSGTTFKKANFGGTPGSNCLPSYLPPKAGPLYYDPTTSNKLSLQSGFNGGTYLVFMICEAPAAISTKGYSN